MEHESAAPLLSDALEGGLEPARARPVWAHVAQCADCQQVMSVMHHVRREVAMHGEALFDGHPASEDLVSFALGDERLVTPVLARIRTHLLVCDACTREVEASRGAEAARPAPWGVPLRTLLPPLRWEPAPALAPALAALLLVLAVPAWQGAFRLPRVESEQKRLLGEVEGLRREQAALGGSLEAERARYRAGRGAVPLLFLPAALRSGASLPRLALRPGQPHMVLVVGFDLSAAARAGRAEVEVSLRHAADGRLAWSLAAPAAELWDPVSRAVTLLVPASAVAPGEYVLQLHRPGASSPDYTGRFEASFAPTR